MKFLELEIQRKIYNLVAKHQGLTLKEITSQLRFKPAQVEYHLSLMEKDGLLISITETNEKQYYVEKSWFGHEQLILKTRKRIYDLLLQNPGLHLSKIASLLHIRVSLAEYHLQDMENDGLIVATKENGFKRYCAEETKLGVDEKKILFLFRQEIPLKIVLFLLKKPNARHKDIADALKLDTNALSYHLNKLKNQGIVNDPDFSEEKGYVIVHVEKIRLLLRKYQLETVVDRFTETWDDFS